MRNGQPHNEELKLWEFDGQERHSPWRSGVSGGFSNHCHWAATTTAIVAAVVAGTASVAGTAVSVVNANKAADAAEKTAEFNAKLAENEAIAARQSADLEAKQIDRRNRLLSGQQRAAYGKAGVDLSAADDVLTDSGIQGELDAAAARYAGDLQVGYAGSKAAGAIFGGKNAASSARLQGTGALISGVGGVAGSVSSGVTAYNNASNRSNPPGFSVNKSPGGRGYSSDFYSRGPQ